MCQVYTHQLSWSTGLAPHNTADLTTVEGHIHMSWYLAWHTLFSYILYDYSPEINN